MIVLEVLRSRSGRPCVAKGRISALVGNSVLTAYIAVGTSLEERKLVHEFGEAYRNYQKQVSMFVPLKWIRRRNAL